MTKPEEPFYESKDRIEVDCYRFKVEILKDGSLKIYAFNSRTKGDVCILIKSDKITLTWEYGKEKDILKERIAEIVFERVLGEGIEDEL